MYLEIEYEFNIDLVGRDDRLGEDYFNTTTYIYEVPKKKIKQAIIECLKQDYNIGGKDLSKFFEDYDLWYQLLDEYEQQVEYHLYDECYEDALQQFQKRK